MKKLVDDYAESLPSFASKREAQRALFADRDAALAHPAVAALDRTPASLLALERLHAETKRGRAKLEKAMGYYLGAVAVAAGHATWTVHEFAFAKGRWEIGVDAGSTVLLGVDGMCLGWKGAKGGRGLLRLYRDVVPAPEKPKRVAKKASPVVDAAAIEEAIVALLTRKTTPALRSRELWDGVRHRLRARRVLLREVEAVIDAMSKRRRLVRREDDRLALR